MHQKSATQFHKTNTTGHKIRKKKPKIIIACDFNTPLSQIHRSSRQKNQQGNFRAKWHYRSSRCNRYLQNIPLRSHIIHLLLSSPWNFLQNRSDFRHKTFNKYKKIEIIYYILSKRNRIQLEINKKNKWSQTILRHMETEQYTAGWPVDCQRSKREKQKILRIKWKRNTTSHNLLDIANAGLIRKYVAMTAYVKKSDR
jgi:hypothetical protein